MIAHLRRCDPVEQRDLGDLPGLREEGSYPTFGDAYDTSSSCRLSRGLRRHRYRHDADADHHSFAG